MHLVVYSHKDIWPDPASEFGFVTDGGFSFQMKAISELFDQTTLVLPLSPKAKPKGLIPLQGKNLRIQPLSPLRGKGWHRKLRLPYWFLRNSLTLSRSLHKADAVHAAIPGDVGTFGMVFGRLSGKPLFVRYCGNWMVTQTVLERFWKWFMRSCTKPHQVMLATGASLQPPSPEAPHVQWIFSSSVSQAQMLRLRGTVRQHPGLAPRVIIVGRQEQAKGTAILIQALHDLLPEYPGLSLEVVGDGGALAEFKDLTARLQMTDRVAFLGKIPQPQVIEHLQKAHLFCFPTYSSEGFPKVVLEALACGLPVVTTKVSALPMVIGQGGGVLMEEATPGSCKSAIKQVLDQKDQYPLLSQQALDVAKNYSLEAWRDQIGTYLSQAWNMPLAKESGSK